MQRIMCFHFSNIHQKKEKKIHLNSICVFFVIPSLVISPPLVLFPVRTVYRGRTER